MVFEGVLVGVLNHFLRPYVKNLDPSQLKVAIWSGNVFLENLELKENALDDLNLPVRISRGYLERLQLKIPWKNLYSAPIIAEIDGLYALAGPASAFKYNPEKDAREKKERKEKHLKRIEDAKKKSEEPKDEKASQDPGLMEKLIANMIRNIQITVKNIHIRYEDSVTSPSHPFSFGITLDSLFVQSTDCEYVVGGSAVDPDPAAMLIYKLLELNCLAVYWQSNAALLGTSPPDDWMDLLKGDIARPKSYPVPGINYVVHPITLEARLQLTTKPGRDMEIPQALVQVCLHQVALSLSRSQFQDIMHLVESLDRMTINLKYLKYRPEVGVREGTREWWNYAISAVTEEEVKRKLEMWSWKHIQQHRKMCRQYTESYSRKLLAKSITSGLQKELDSLEERLDVFNLTICRELAKSKAKQKRRVQAEAVKEAESGGGGGWWGWATGWVSGEGDSKEEEAIVMPTEEELQEERRKMYEAIGYSQNAELPIYPKEYVAHRIEIQLEEVSVQLWNENGIVAHMLTSSVSAHLQNRPSSKNITVQTTVGHLMARGLTYGTPGEGGEGPVILFSKCGKEASLLDVSVDINPVNSQVNQSLQMRLLPIQITYHADTVDAVIAMFVLSKDVQLQRLSAAAASTLEELKTQGRAGLEHAISQRKLLDLDIVINSPCLVVPQHGDINKSSCVLVADLGRLEIKSDLKSNVPDVREATDEELDEAFYDHFTLTLSRLQVLLAGPKQDWTDAWSSSPSSPLHLLEPATLDLELRKSLLPNDTRLPNMKVKGELASLSLSVSDKKIKQLLQLVQSLPLPPPSLARKNMESSSAYSLPDRPSDMDPDIIVETISETLLIGSQDTQQENGSSEEYLTASECESDDEGVLHHSSHTKTVPASTTKLSLQFAINSIAIIFNEHHELSGRDTPRLHLLVTSMTSGLLIRSWDMQLTACIGNLHIADHYVTGSDGKPGTLLSTQLTDSQKFLTFTYSKFDPQAPHYVTEFKSTRQSITADVSLLKLNLHTDSLLNLMEIGRSITAVMKTTDDTEISLSKQKSLASTSSSSLGADVEGPSSLRQLPSEKDLELRATLVGVEVGVCGGDMGEVMSASVTGLETQLDIFRHYMTVNASMADVLLLDNEPSAEHKKIIHKMDEAKNVISLKVTMFKSTGQYDPSDLSTCDLDIAADVERLRVMVVFRFLSRIQRVVTQVLQQLKLDQTAIDSAREAATNTVSQTAEVLKEKSSSRVKLNVVVRAPLLIIPYTVSALSSTSSPPSLVPSPQRAFVANLGELLVKNVFKLASEVMPVTAKKGESDQSLFLSPLGHPAIVDCMTVTISSVQLGRVLDIEQGIERLVSGGLHATSRDVSAESQVLLWPLEFKGQIRRRLSDWCTFVPTLSIACKIESIKMQFSPVDYQHVMYIIQDLKQLKAEPVEIEDVPSELATTDTATEDTHVAEPDKTSDETADTGKEGEEKTEEDESIPDAVSIHVEAALGAVELLLYSDMGEVAEVNVKGVAASVNKHGYGITVHAGICGVEVLDCSPDVLYRKIVSVEEDSSAVEAQVTYFDGSKRGTYYNINKWDLDLKLHVNRVRVVALYLFVARILNYVQQLQTPDSKTAAESQIPKELSEDSRSSSVRTLSKPLQDTPSMKMKLDISIQAPEITVPLSSLSRDIVVLDLGQLTLQNEFLLLDVGFSADMSVALYEQHYVKLTNLQIYRSVWDGSRNKPTECQRGLLEPVTLSVEMQRNLSTHWFHGIPSISVDARLEPLQMVASADDIESLCLILNGNLKETCSSRGGSKSNQDFSTVHHPHTKHGVEGPRDKSEESVEHKEPFTEFLVSARLKSIGLKLYFKDHPLTCDDVSTWSREGKREFMEIVLKNFQAGFKKESSGVLSANLTMENCILDDLRAVLEEEVSREDEEDEYDDDGSTRESSVDTVDVPKKQCSEQRIRRMIQKRQFDTFSSTPLISMKVNLSQENYMWLTTVTTTVDGIQVLANLKFIKAVVSFLLESINPLMKGTGTGDEEEEEEEVKALRHQVSPVSRSHSTTGGRESRIQISVEVVRPLIALLEDARQMDSTALVCQLELHTDFSRRLPSNLTSIQSSIRGLTLFTAKYPDLDKTIFKPVVAPLVDDILAYIDQWEGTTKITATVPALTVILSPATVRLVLNSVRSLDIGHGEEEVGETAPSDLWSSKPISRGRLRKKWFLKEESTEPAHVASTSSNVNVQPSVATSVGSHLWNETLEVLVDNITVIIEQEVTTPTLRTFPAIAVSMGKYSRKALVVKLWDWSSMFKAHTELSLEASYYNIRTDSWEPILEPVVDPRNESQYISWGMVAKVVSKPPISTKDTAEKPDDQGDEEEDEDEESAALSIEVSSDSALQLTVTKTSLGIFTDLVQAYTKEKPVVLEDVDTPETHDAAFMVVNKLGKNYPVTIKPSNTLKVHGAYSSTLRQGDLPLPLHPVGNTVQMNPGELLPRDSHLRRVHIVQLQVVGFDSLNVSLGMYERVYYPLASDDDNLRVGMVVDIDRTTGTPTVTLRSPLQVCSHLEELVTVYHSLSHSPPVAGSAASIAHVPAGSTIPLPLDATSRGYLYFKLPHTGLSQPAVSWEDKNSQDIACAVTRSSRELGSHRKQSFSFIHTQLEEEEYSRMPSFSLSDRSHHLVHLHQPLVVHNLLPYSLALGEEGYSMVLIGSGCQANISYTKLSHTEKFLVEVEKKDKKWIGSFMMGSKNYEETPFTVTAHDSSSLELIVKKEEKGTWQLSVFSRNWIVNKTGLTLQYRTPGHRNTDVYVHHPKSVISLYPHDQVCVRVVKGGRYSEWSSKFSLEALGSEGIFSCSFKDSSEEYQIGTKVDLSQFSGTRIVTLSPFFMVNNTTKDTISFRECGLDTSYIYTVGAGELLPFWPCGNSELLEVSVRDDVMLHHSAPFNFTETGSILMRTGSGQQQPELPSPSQQQEVPAVEVEVQVTGSANIVTFTPYYMGCVPLQLINYTSHPLDFKQIDGPQSYLLHPSHSLMYTWDLPQGERKLLFSGNKKIRLSPQDGSGSFALPKESASSAVDPQAHSVAKYDIPPQAGSVAADGQREKETLESIVEGTTEEKGGEGEEIEEEEEQEEEEVEEEMDEGEEKGEEYEAGQPIQEDEGGSDETDFPQELWKRFTSGVRKNVTSLGRTVTKRKTIKKRGKTIHWVCFMDGLQRVVLFTNSVDLRKRVEKGSEKETPHTELSLSLIGTGLSLVDDIRGQEVAYIGIPQSQKEWQICVKKMWKALPSETSEKLEQAYDPSKKSKGRNVLPNSDYEVDFSRMNLYEISSGTKNKLRRSHFEGVYARLTCSQHLTSINVRISHVQIDNQLPRALNPIILSPYPPPPSVASVCAPKPFIEGTIVIHKTDQSNINQIQYLKFLIQEVGVNVDMSFLMALLGLLSQVSSSTTEAQIVEREVEYAKLPLKKSKVAAVSAAVSRNYYQFLHLSPLIIHLSFSLEMSHSDGQEAKKVTDMNIMLSTIFNFITSFAAIVGKTKDAELKLRYFEVVDEALTQQALLDRIKKHYIQEGVIQMYRVVLGLEVLGNPVGFVKGLKEGTVGLFYHPFQGAVLGPEEFLEGMKLGGKQFVAGTVGGITGVLGKVTGVIGDAAAKLTMDEEFVKERKHGRGTVVQGFEGAARGVFEGVTGIVSQPIKGAKKEGLWGFVKGTGKGMLGLVLRPTGGIIDLTSATFNAVQRTTKVGDYEVSQLRPPRFIGQPKFVSPYSPHKAEGYALFLAVDNGSLRETDVYFDHIELEEKPLKIVLITNNQFMLIKKNMFDRLEEDWKVMLKDMYEETAAHRNRVVIPVLEEQGRFLSSKKKVHQSVKHLEAPTPDLASKIVVLVNQAREEYYTTTTQSSPTKKRS